MNYSALSTELTSDPLARGYAGMSDEVATVSLNATDRPKAVPEREVKLAAIRQGSWADILKACDDPVHPGRDVALLTVALIDDPIERGDVDFEDPDVIAQLDALVATGLLTAEQRTALEALQDNRQSRGEELGWGFVKVGHVANARAK